MSKLKGKNKLRQRKATAGIRDLQRKSAQIVDATIRQVVAQAVAMRKETGIDITHEMLNDQIRDALKRIPTTTVEKSLRKLPGVRHV